MKSHILVIEDEESLRSMLELKLYQIGFSVSVAATGKHALQKLKSGQKYDLIICDLKMPAMDGLELFKTYKDLGGTAPFLLVTGYPDKEKIIKAIQLGIRDVILKPVKHVDLIEKIQQILATSPASAAA